MKQSRPARTYIDNALTIDEGSQPFTALLWQATSIFPFSYPLTPDQPLTTEPNYFLPQMHLYDDMLTDLHRLCTRLPLHRREISFLSAKPMFLPLWDDVALTSLLDPLQKISQHIITYAHSRQSPIQSTETERFFNYSLFGSAFNDQVTLETKMKVKVVHDIPQFKGILWGVIKNLQSARFDSLPGHPTTFNYPRDNDEENFVPMVHGDLMKFHYKLQLQSRFWVKLLSFGDFSLPDVAPTAFNSTRLYKIAEQEPIAYKIPALKQAFTERNKKGLHNDNSKGQSHTSPKSHHNDDHNDRDNVVRTVSMSPQQQIDPNQVGKNTNLSSHPEIDQNDNNTTYEARTIVLDDWKSKLQLLPDPTISSTGSTPLDSQRLVNTTQPSSRLINPDKTSQVRDSKQLPVIVSLGTMAVLNNKLPLFETQYAQNITPVQKLPKLFKPTHINELFLEYTIYMMLWDSLYRTIGFNEKNDPNMPLNTFNTLDEFSKHFNRHLDDIANTYFKPAIDITLARKLFPHQAEHFADGIRLATFVSDNLSGDNHNNNLDQSNLLIHTHRSLQFSLPTFPVQQPKPIPKTLPQSIIAAIYGYTVFLPPLYPPRLAYPSGPLIYLHSHELLLNEDKDRKMKSTIKLSDHGFVTSHDATRFQSMHAIYDKQALDGFKDKLLWTYEEFCLQYILWAPALYHLIAEMQETILTTRHVELENLILCERQREILLHHEGKPIVDKTKSRVGKVVGAEPPLVEKNTNAQITTEIIESEYYSTTTITQVETIDIKTTINNQSSVRPMGMMGNTSSTGIYGQSVQKSTKSRKFNYLDESQQLSPSADNNTKVGITNNIVSQAVVQFILSNEEGDLVEEVENGATELIKKGSPSCFVAHCIQEIRNSSPNPLNPNDLINTFDDIPYIYYTSEQVAMRLHALESVWKSFKKVSLKDWPYQGLDYNIIHESFFAALAMKDPEVKPTFSLQDVTTMGLEEIAVKFYEVMKSQSLVVSETSVDRKIRKQIDADRKKREEERKAEEEKRKAEKQWSYKSQRRNVQIFAHSQSQPMSDQQSTASTSVTTETTTTTSTTSPTDYSTEDDFEEVFIDGRMEKRPKVKLIESVHAEPVFDSYFLHFPDIVNSLELTPRKLFQSTKDCFVGAPPSVYHLELFEQQQEEELANGDKKAGTALRSENIVTGGPLNPHKTTHQVKDTNNNDTSTPITTHSTITTTTKSTITSTKQPSKLQHTRPIDYFQSINSMSWIRYYSDPLAQPRVDDFYTLLNGYDYTSPTTGETITLIYPSQQWLNEGEMLIEPGQVIEYGGHHFKWTIKFPTTPMTRQCDAFIMGILHRTDAKVLEFMFLSMNESNRDALFLVEYDVMISTPFSHQHVTLHFWDLFTIASTREYAPELAQMLLEQGRLELDEIEQREALFLKK